MRWVKAWWLRQWSGYVESYNLDEEVRENNPVTCAMVLVCFIFCVLLLWLFEPTFTLLQGIIILSLGTAGCITSLISWSVWCVKCRTASYILQLIDSPLLGMAVLWAGITIPNTVGMGVLLFWVLMGQKWAQQYALHAFSAISILLPAVFALIFDHRMSTIFVLSAGSIFFIITARYTKMKRQLLYGRARVSDVLRTLEALCERKVIQYHSFSEAMRRLREMSFILRANAMTLSDDLLSHGRCEECHAMGDIEATAQQMQQLLAEPLQYVDDGDASVFTIAELMDAISMRRSISVTLQGAGSAGKMIISAPIPLRYIMIRGDLDVVALAVHSLIDNAWEAGALNVTVDVIGCESALKVRVSDNGRGIPVTVRKRLFDAGFVCGTARAGMGLFFARQAMRFYGGDVRLVSTGESGSVFEIEARMLDAHVCATYDFK